MKQRALWMGALALALAAPLAQGAGAGLTSDGVVLQPVQDMPAPAPAPDPAPIPDDPAIVVQVFQDNFSGPTFATYQAQGGATLTTSPGRLTVSVPPGDVNGGFTVGLPQGGTGVRCLKFDGFAIPDGTGVRSMVWNWIGVDDLTKAVFTVLSVSVDADDKANSVTIRHRKANGTTAVATVPNKKYSDIKSYKWDTRRNGTQVMLEVVFNDGGTYNSDWIDPAASTISGFQVTGDIGTYSFSSLTGMEYHVDSMPAAPATAPSFDSAALAGLGNYFLGQTDDSDLVAVGKVSRIVGPAAPLAGDPRPRLAVEYELQGTLRGSESHRLVTVLHALDRPSDAARFAPGKRWILYLQRAALQGGEQPGIYMDYGHPTGVVRFSARNLRAVAARIALFYTGGATDENR